MSSALASGAGSQRRPQRRDSSSLRLDSACKAWGVALTQRLVRQIFTRRYKTGVWDLTAFVDSGGMPSSHSSLCTVRSRASSLVASCGSVGLHQLLTDSSAHALDLRTGMRGDLGQQDAESAAMLTGRLSRRRSHSSLAWAARCLRSRCASAWWSCTTRPACGDTQVPHCPIVSRGAR